VLHQLGHVIQEEQPERGLAHVHDFLSHQLLHQKKPSR
jgi:hypothetical protein